MRQIVLDTETTGLEHKQGHRIIEVGCVEMINRRVTKGDFHYYINPDREIDQGAIEVHGITNEFLEDKPHWADISADFLEYIRGAAVIIHNAPFDVGFINAELKRQDPSLGRMEDYCTILDTLALAREMHPGQRNTLDALCKRYDIDNSHRELHGALLDSRILADVYLMMTGGQKALTLDEEDEAVETQELAPVEYLSRTPGGLKVLKASEQELALHSEALAAVEKLAGQPPLFLQAEGHLPKAEGHLPKAEGHLPKAEG
ncbi:MAG: DNA polymerase III subunit epsilon [bacterium]